MCSQCTRRWGMWVMLLVVMVMAGCSSRATVPPTGDVSPSKKSKPYVIKGKKYYPVDVAAGYTEEGLASWYGHPFHGRKTANGEKYDMYAMTAAHKLLPFNTMLKVTNLENGKSTRVRVNDRGPFVAQRILDLSKSAASKLGVIGPGTARVRIEALNGVSGYRNGDITGTFYIQVGAYAVKDNARNQLAKMRARNLHGRAILKTVRGKRLWRVQAGPYTSLSRAKQAVVQIRKTYSGSFIIAAD